MESIKGTETRVAAAATPDVAGQPAWAAKPLSDLTADEIADVLAHLDQHKMDDVPLIRVLTSGLARRLGGVAAVPC